MAYTLGFKKKVIEAYKTGDYSQNKIAELFKISLTTLKIWLRKKKNGEDLAPLTTKEGRPRKIDSTGKEFVKQLVEENPSITLSELSDAYNKQFKILAGTSVFHRLLKELDLRYKKLSVKSIQQNNSEVQKKKKFI